MFSAALKPFLPHTWSDVSCLNDFREVEISKSSMEYDEASECLDGWEIKRIVRVENPFLYGHFLLKKAEYESRGGVSVSELYHCTAARKVPSILRTNLDWRMARRVKFGRGVSFSPSTSYANKEASRDNGDDRAMIIADVLTHKIENVEYSCTLPGSGYDTTRGNRNKVYVKFYDNEFYPKYVIYYDQGAVVYSRRGW